MRNRALGLSRRKGIALIYLSLTMTVLMGFCSFAVDLGRYQTAKTEIRRAADAAARAAVANLTAGTTAATNAATAMASNNKVDGLPATSPNVTVTVQFLNWTSKSNYTVVAGASTANAVRVTVSRTVPLLFGQVLGIATKNATEYATALISTTTSNPYVSARGNPWLSGEPTGTTASVTDAGYNGPNVVSNHPWALDLAGPPGSSAASGQPYNSPAPSGLTVTPGSTITLSNASGLATNDVSVTANTDANGNYSSGGVSSVTYDYGAVNGGEHGMSTIWAPHNAILGVFLDNNTPDSEGAIPTALDFSNQSARDYTTVSPLMRQVFYIGDGQTSMSAQQTIVVPPNATRLYLGTMDGHEWSNNSGGFNVTLTQTSISMVE